MSSTVLKFQNSSLKINLKTARSVFRTLRSISFKKCYVTLSLEFQYIELVDNLRCLYYHMDTVQLSFRIMTHSNILTSPVSDPVCKSGNTDDKDPEGFQLLENPCTIDTVQSLYYESLNVTIHNFM